MKVIIDSEGMVLDYEPLEKGQEVEIDHEIGMIWIQSGRAHRPDKAADKKTLSNEKGESEEKDANLKEEEKKDGSEGDNPDKTETEETEKMEEKRSEKTTPQSTADKKAKEKR
jgi:hypothetical protein